MALASRHLARIASLALVAGTLVVTTGTGAAVAADAVDGGLTAGDSLFPNQGNSGYDALHYDIDLSVDVAVSGTNNAPAATSFRTARTTVDARTTGAPLSSYAFDFQGSASTLEASTLNVDSVTVDGRPATFTRIENTTVDDATTDVHKLVVTPATPVSGDFSTVVTYSGVPVRHTDTDGSYEGWNNTTDGATFVNQPVGSMTAFPNNNTPRDKATYTISVDAPSKLATSATAAAANPGLKDAAVVSNGELASRTPSKDGSRTTWVWEQKKPMASMVSLISVGRYTMYESSITLASGRVLPEWSFIDPAISVANQQTTQATRAQLTSILNFLETKYGPYPGNSVGLVTDVVPSAINYALETQDRSFFPNSAGRSTTIHELTHQWFGDGVSPTDWNDIWVSEGTATYTEAQTAYEGAGSSTTSTESSYFTSWSNASTTSSLWAVPTARMAEASQLFGAQVYTRGAMTLEALRTAIGAADFATLMRTWQDRHIGTSKRTTDFIALAEEISGRDLTAFFDEWIYRAGKPSWPAKFTLALAGPTTPVSAGAAASYTLTSRNTGRVAQTSSVVTVDLADVLDDASLGTLPEGTSVDGTTLTWTVPSTAVGATSTVTIPVAVADDATGASLKAAARASTLGSTCAGCTSTVTVGAPPVSPSAVPTVTGGAPTVGQPLTAATAGWAGGTTFTYQWLVDGTPVAGATTSTFTPSVTAVGLTVRVMVTGSKGSASPVTRTSEATAAVARTTQTGSTPVVSGTPKIGRRLTLDVGTWEPGTFFTYQWAVNGVNVTAANGGTGPSFVPSLATQVGQTVTVTVTGTKSGYGNVARTSTATAPVVAGEFGDVPTPTLSAAPRALAPVSAVPGVWEDNTTFAYQWSVEGSPVTGATGVTFTPTLAQVGARLTVAVTGTKPGYPTAVTKVSEAVAVAPAAQTATPVPTISGTPTVGAELTADPGTWDDGTTLTFQWSAGDVAVDGATGSTFTPGAATVGKTVTVAVTGTREAYATVTRTSKPTAEVAPGALVETPRPTISGTPKVGVALTGTPGAWDAGTTLTYQWLVGGSAVEGAMELSFTPDASAAAKIVTFAVTGKRDGYTSVTTTSEPTVEVAAGDQATTVPTVQGVAKVGVELTGSAGEWAADTTLSYRWLVDGDAVEGATGTTFTPAAGMVGDRVAFEVTGRRAGYATATRTSEPTGAVVEGDLVLTPVPAVRGTVQVGGSVTADAGTWDAGTALAYQWTRDGSPVTGATGPTYSLTPADHRAVLAVTVRGSKDGYRTVSQTSAGQRVVAGAQARSPRPSVKGTRKVGRTLTVRRASYDAGVKLSYRWYVNGHRVGGNRPTLRLAKAYRGKRVVVRVTANKPGYVTEARNSRKTARVR
ncbi:hypothetical protein IFT73_02795 [Aeromicrobium sp. CFBP 8757]|uniref:M1 family metallopeptidase n=1 Tax=Aeromicrobium sp. CFBP 8757 TaxID=2775288 RepID=UPI001783C850|nr:M1 family metallopeptidase [Aeromicrobium sp. CFBP 8757]MBD8605771.1 hypothetical protein [Aeromicrobium sp. CFBP 8757]